MGAQEPRNFAPSQQRASQQLADRHRSKRRDATPESFSKSLYPGCKCLEARMGMTLSELKECCEHPETDQGRGEVYLDGDRRVQSGSASSPSDPLGVQRNYQDNTERFAGGPLASTLRPADDGRFNEDRAAIQQPR